MTWKKYLKTINNPLDNNAIQHRANNSAAGATSISKYASILPEVYAGHPNRIQRYYQYEDMARDSDISAALDTIADFCTQSEEQNEMPFVISYTEEPTESQVTTLTLALNQWVRLNKFKRKLWKMVRNCAQNGDAFFVRDPEDHSWIWIDHYSVELVKMSEDGKSEPSEYVVKNFNPFVVERLGTRVDDLSRYRVPGATPFAVGRPYNPNASSNFQMAGADKDQHRGLGGLSSQIQSQYVSIKAENMIHLALNEDMDINFPFGKSVLDPIFKTFKQKELLEDSILIYRVQRAPERRVFYIDVGSMSTVRAQAYVEGIKNEIHQRRIPNRTGGGASIMDTAYNPLCLAMDTRVPLLDGRTLTIAELADEYNNGKENWVYSCDPETGEIVPGNITWAGITRHDAEVIRLTFDNGKTLTCTPDHKIVTRDHGFIEASRLDIGESIMPFYHTDDRNSIFDNCSQTWVSTSNVVASFFKNINKHQEFTFANHNIGKEKTTVLHRDFNHSNNDPRNLQWMNNHDYLEFCDYMKKDVHYNDVVEVEAGYNHKLVSIERVNNIDTGTITVDGNERWHSHHTFAIESGIFVKNSMLDDYFLAQCLSLNTEIPLLDGRTLTLQELINEYDDGKVNYVYSLNKDTHEMEPGKVAWAGVTRKNAKIVRVTLDNGEYIDATPDHRFIMRDGREVEAQDLQPNDSLMPLYLNKGRSGTKQKIAKYMRYVSNADRKTKFVHTTVCPKPKGREYVVHHKDFNSFNNNPDNLEVMTWQDHEILHKNAGTYSLGNQWSTKEGRKKLIDGMRKYHDNASAETKARIRETCSKNGMLTWVNATDAKKKSMKEHLRKVANECAIRRTLQFSDEMFTRMTELYDLGYRSISTLCPALRDDDIFQKAFARANLNTQRSKNSKKIGNYIGDGTLNKIVKFAGYDGWQDFKDRYAKNHKVLSVEILPYREDTGDITVEGPSESHVFALSAGIYVHNSAEGRGSKVEVLPSGDALGEITDLTYFLKKMARGLRIPTSYLPLGNDDQPASYNDGKLGQALIEEFRFNKFCMRIQNLISPVFDKFFKEYIAAKGVQIEDNLFELQFQPPQNFTKYRQIEIDLQQTQVYGSVAGNKKLSERFKFKRFLNLTDEEILENERMWAEENPDKMSEATGSTSAEQNPEGDLGSVGFNSTGDFGDDIQIPDTDMPDFDLGGDEPPPPAPDNTPPPAPDSGGGEPA